MSRHFNRRDRRLARMMAREVAKSKDLAFDTARERKRFVAANWRRFAGDNADLEVR